MTETLWYTLLLLVQCIQVDPATHRQVLEFEVYSSSRLAYSLEHRGSLSSGFFQDLLTGTRFGDFELLKRAGRRYAVTPAMAVEDPAGTSESGTASTKATSTASSTGPASGAQAAKAGSATTPATTKTSSAEKAAGPATSTTGPASGAQATAGAEPAEPEIPDPFYLDFAPALRTMTSFGDNPVQAFAWTMPASKDSKEATAKAAPAKEAPKAATAGSPAEGAEAPGIKVWRYPEFWVLTAEEAQLVVILRFREF